MSLARVGGLGSLHLDTAKAGKPGRRVQTDTLVLKVQEKLKGQQDNLGEKETGRHHQHAFSISIRHTEPGLWRDRKIQET
jgi:hypothetical protein